MTKSELLADIAEKCGGKILATVLVETVGDVKRYITNVFTVGQDSDGGPIAKKRNYAFYVDDEGGESETAYYDERNFVNPEDKNPTGSTFAAIDGICNNPELRQRLSGVIVAAAMLIKEESPGTDDRRRVARECMVNKEKMLDVFMFYVASNGTIQANGGAATDSDLDYVVRTVAWDKIVADLALG